MSSSLRHCLYPATAGAFRNLTLLLTIASLVTAMPRPMAAVPQDDSAFASPARRSFLALRAPCDMRLRKMQIERRQRREGDD